MKHAWLHELNQKLAGKPEQPPKGYVNSREAAAEWGCAWSTAQNRLVKMNKAGLLNVVKVRVLAKKRNGGQRLIPIPYYGKK
jgi:Mn-dependent DtxR family transcriptional regulator